MRKLLLVLLSLMVTVFAFSQYTITSSPPNSGYPPHSITGAVLNPNTSNATTTGGTVIHLYNAGGSASLNTWSNAITLPFNVSLGASSFNQFCVSKNGLLTFTTSLANTTVASALNTNASLPNVNVPDNTIAYFWDNMATTLGTGDNVYMFTYGTAPYRQVYIQNYSYWMSTSSFNYWAIVFDESSGIFHVVDMSYYAAAISATVGVQLNSTTAVQVTTGISGGIGSPNLNWYGTSSSLVSNDAWYNFTPQKPNDAGVNAITSPTATTAPGVSPITCNIKNWGSSPLSSVNVYASVTEGLSTTNYGPVTWTTGLPLASGAVSGNQTIASHNFVGGLTSVKVWTANPNGVTDSLNFNDTLVGNYVICGPLSGTYTINSALPSSGTNFASFTDAVATLLGCGVSGPVTINVVAGSGPYNEQIMLTAIPGASRINTVTFNGNGETLTYNSTNTNARHVVHMNGVKHVTFSNLNIVTGLSTYGWNVRFSNQADSNRIHKCTLQNSTTVASSNYVVMPFTNSATTYAGAGFNGSWNTIDSNDVIGGYYSTYMYGNGAGVGNDNNKFYYNNVRDFYYMAYYMYNGSDNEWVGNDISRPTRTSVTTLYGFYLNGASPYSKRNKVIGNRIHDTNGATPTYTGSCYGVYIYNQDVAEEDANIIANNAIYNVNFNGSIYALYNNGANGTKIIHNTVALDDQSSTSTLATRGINILSNPTNAECKDNLVTITRSGTGIKHGIYYGTVGTSGDVDYNDVYINAVNANYGYYSTNRLTLVDWQADTPYGDNSHDINPLYQNPAAGDFLPTELSFNNLGQAVGIATDITGAPRSLVIPDIGAWEYNPPRQEAALAAINSPTANFCGMGSATETVNVRFLNAGSDILFFNQDSFNIHVDVAGVVPQNFVYSLNSGSLSAGLGMDIDLTSMLDLSTMGTYNITIYLVGDSNAILSNDTLRMDVNVRFAPGAVVATDVSSCGPDSMMLTATGDADYIMWLEANDLGEPYSLVGLGNDLDLGYVTSTETRYALNVTGGVDDSTGAADISIGTYGTYTYYTDGLVFDVHNSMILHSVDVVTETGGYVTVRVLNSTGGVYSSRNVFVADSGLHTLVLDMFIEPGHYAIDAGGSTVGGLVRNTAGAAYPYSIYDVVDITNAVNELPGYYYFFYNWSVNAVFCTSDTLAVSAIINDIPTVDLGADRAFCSADGDELDAANPGATIMWSTGETTRSIVPSATGTYAVEVTSPEGCSNTDTVDITINMSPVVSLGMDREACNMETLDAGNPAASHSWSTGETTQTVDVSATDYYWVIVEDANGCVTMDTVEIDVNVGPVVDLGADRSVCDEAELDAENADASHIWSDGGANRFNTVTTSGTYWVEVVDENGCMGTDTVNIMVYPTPSVDLGPDQDTCGPHTIYLFTLDAGPGDTYAWSTGETGRYIYPTTGGTYNVTVTSGPGCTASDEVMITISNNAPIANVIPDQTSCSPVVLDAGASGGSPYSYLWSTGANTQTITAGSTGTYWVEVSNACGSDVKSTHIEVLPSPTASFDTVSVVSCEVTLTNMSSNATSYVWDFGDGTIQSSTDISVNPTYTYQTPGTYTITLTASNDCGDNVSTTLVQVQCVGVGINNNDIEALISIYPNPATDFVNVKFDGFENMNDVQISLIDMEGRTVLQSIPSGVNHVIDVSHLAAGTYNLRIVNEFGVVNRKIQKL